MKQNEATIFIFIASILLGILISSNMNFGKFNNKVLLNPAEYQKAYDYNMKLDKEIRNLKEEYNEYSKKIKKYKENDHSKEKLKTDMKNEILVNNMILGNEGVEGEGITITLGDSVSKLQTLVSDPNEITSLMVHDKDVLGVINDLKYAGAECISINGQRVTNRSYILCWGVFALVDKVKLPGPYKIEAIGDKEKLYSYIEGNESYIAMLKIRGVNVAVTKEGNLRIVGNAKKTNYSSMKEIKESK